MFFVLSKFYFNSECKFFTTWQVYSTLNKKRPFHDEYTRHKHRKDQQCRNNLNNLASISLYNARTMPNKVNARVWPVRFTNHPIYNTDGIKLHSRLFRSGHPREDARASPPTTISPSRRSFHIMPSDLFCIFKRARSKKAPSPPRLSDNWPVLLRAAEMRRDAAI